MKLVIFGATGQVGRYLVQQAILMGHHVRAFGRNVHELPDETPLLSKIKGGVFDEADVANAVESVDVVLSALGGSFDGTDKTRSLGIRTIIGQMQKAGVHRIVALGGAGVLDSANGGLQLDQKDYPEEYIPVGKEHQKAWEALAASTLNWTFVCSPDIKNQDATGKFLASANSMPAGALGYINAGDLALFMLQEAEKNEFPKERVGISAI